MGIHYSCQEQIPRWLAVLLDALVTWFAFLVGSYQRYAAEQQPLLVENILDIILQSHLLHLQYPEVLCLALVLWGKGFIVA